jgi:AAA+ superfamily predicted ATPase
VEVCGDSVTASPLRIDERVLHYLAGVSYVDERLAGTVQHVAPSGMLAGSYAAHVASIVSAWSSAKTDALPIVQLCGDDAEAARRIASAACAALGLRLYSVRSDTFPAGAEIDFVRLWIREAAISDCALLVECGTGHDATGTRRDAMFGRLLHDVNSGLIVSTTRAVTCGSRATLTIDVGRPTSDEQLAAWHHSLGSAGSRLNGQLDAVVAEFDFDIAAIERAGAEVVHRARQGSDLAEATWRACRVQSRADIEGLARRIVPSARWNDLVLPESQRQTLRQIAVHVRRRATVYSTWGFGARASRGLGLSALFCGPTGTGKTMAGEVLANELGLDLYHIDLSQVVSKYIGETEKNLGRVFDAAERGGGILLFDEADALFGKRSEVKDSHDRYANVEISYLLQRMEAYRGLAILTTNMKAALDPAFMRRIRFVVHFPFPEAAERAEIWRRVFPPETPTRALDCAKLARLAVAGGNIRAIAMNAAFLAADAGEPVGMAHLLRAAQTECMKLERPLADAEVAGWR